MPGTSISLDAAIDLTRTGDLWVFRGRSAADRAIQLATNSPVNHVGMAVVLGDLPPLMWHAELGKVAAGRVVRCAATRRPAARALRRGHDLDEPVRPAGLGAAAQPRRDGGHG